MSRRQAPALALWLLDRLGFAGGNAPLVGDLLEEFRNGRSALWFWRQTLTVLANSITRRVAPLQIYWIAVLVGFAAQLPLSLLLFHLHRSRPAHGVGWTIALFLLVCIGGALIHLLGRLLGRRVFGKNSKDVKLILIKQGGPAPGQRSALFGAAAFETFWGIFFPYCLFCVLAPPLFSSFAEVVVCELIWLGFDEVKSEVSGIRTSRRAAAEREWETRVWPHLNKVEVSLICSDGTTVVLKPETCIETIFASANEQLIGAIFTRGVSLEEIRHAVWLAGAAEHGWPKTDPASMFGPAPIARFARLLEDDNDIDRMKRYRNIPPARRSSKRPGA